MCLSGRGLSSSACIIPHARHSTPGNSIDHVCGCVLVLYVCWSHPVVCLSIYLASHAYPDRAFWSLCSYLRCAWEWQRPVVRVVNKNKRRTCVANIRPTLSSQFQYVTKQQRQRRPAWRRMEACEVWSSLVPWTPTCMRGDPRPHASGMASYRIVRVSVSRYSHSSGRKTPPFVKRDLMFIQVLYRITGKPKTLYKRYYYTSVPNCKSLKFFWRVKPFQVWQNLYNKVLIFMILNKYH